jgi:hypothetical protein
MFVPVARAAEPAQFLKEGAVFGNCPFVPSQAAWVATSQQANDLNACDSSIAASSAESGVDKKPMYSWIVVISPPARWPAVIDKGCSRG